MTSTLSQNANKNSATLLLGASGRLGRMVQVFWPRTADLRCQSRQALPGYLRFDPLSDSAALRLAMEGVGTVICLAGVTPAQAEASGDALSVNSDLALATVQAAAEVGVSRVLLASSAAVYGAGAGPLQETAHCAPVSAYGRAKLAMERLALAEADRLAQGCVVLRIGNVVGADAILGGWRPGIQIDAFAAARTPARSYIGPRTLVRVLEDLCRAQGLPKILNVAAPGNIEMGALLDAAGLAWTPRPAGPATIETVALCTERLEAHVDFDPGDCSVSAMVAEWREMQTLDHVAVQ